MPRSTKQVVKRRLPIRKPLVKKETLEQIRRKLDRDQGILIRLR